MSKPFTYELRVRFSDTDAAGIVYFGAFATYFDESFLAALRSHGIGWEEHHSYGFFLPIVEQHIQFYHPIRAGDKITVFVAISRIGNRSFTSQHKVILRENGEDILVASGHITRAVVTPSFQAQLIPQPLKNALLTIEGKLDIDP